jgi:hypothetical protein
VSDYLLLLVATGLIITTVMGFQPAPVTANSTVPITQNNNLSTKWEYLILTRYIKKGRWRWDDEKDQRSSQEVLNEKGKDGWELVSVIPIASGVGDFSGTTTGTEYFLKREIR